MSKAYRDKNPENWRSIKTKWAEKNPEKAFLITLRKRARFLKLDPYQVEQYYKDHHGLCDICGDKPSGRFRSLSIDHDHITGEFRGLLCNSCNLALGKFKDSREILLRAAEYLS